MGTQKPLNLSLAALTLLLVFTVNFAANAKVWESNLPSPVYALVNGADGAWYIQSARKDLAQFFADGSNAQMICSIAERVFNRIEGVYADGESTVKSRAFAEAKTHLVSVECEASTVVEDLNHLRAVHALFQIF